MNLPELIENYGYWVVFAGTLLEGESVLLLAGFSAYSGLLELHTVIGVATLGSFLGDQLWFLLGRTQGAKLLARFPDFDIDGSRAVRHVLTNVRGLSNLPLVVAAAA